jgi:hypothetical protein|tara:strand:+ start:804 stop:932 length:129 start_codon:yes stop_codon:yes gene_type:complete
MKAETFDEKFETGEDITQYLDLTGIRRPDRNRNASTWTSPSG